MVAVRNKIIGADMHGAFEFDVSARWIGRRR